MKLCTNCQQQKSESDFNYKNKNKKKLHSKCKECQSKYSKKHYIDNKDVYIKRSRLSNNSLRQRNRTFLKQYKEQRGCCACHETEPYVLDFHHIDKSKKRMNISIMSRSSLSIKTIMSEIDKCIILCSNCHRKLHKNLISILGLTEY